MLNALEQYGAMVCKPFAAKGLVAKGLNKVISVLNEISDPNKLYPRDCYNEILVHPAIPPYTIKPNTKANTNPSVNTIG